MTDTVEPISHLIGRPVPDFTAPAVLGDNSITESFNLKSYIDGSYALVFFWPLDFTFVCPSEILAHDHRMSEFDARGVKVVGVSVDSQYTHLAWKKTPTDQGGLGQVRFPMVADLTQGIARSFGVLLGNSVALRASFLIDKAGTIRHYVINDLPLGRNVDETLRMVDALQFHDEHGEVCPAGWKKGAASMTATPEGVAKFLAAHADEM